MVNKFSRRRIRNLVIASGSLILAVSGGYLVWAYFASPAIPSEFSDARQHIAAISAQLVDLTSTTNYKIKDINYLDSDGHYRAGVALLNKAKEENQKAFEQAVELSNQLKKMTESLPDIKSLDARQLSQEAVSLELALIVHFINYTKAMDDLLNLIQNRLAAPGKYQREIDVKLTDINAQVLLVNNLNQQFLEKMTELDAILKK